MQIFVCIEGFYHGAIDRTDLPAELVLALKRRAAKRNHSAEHEHREF